MRILIIEDEKKLAATIKKGLISEGFAADMAFSGEDGLEQASYNSYDCIILDLMLPGIDGHETCRALRRDNISCPILMLTAIDEVDNKIQGLNEGADDYLTKPFHFGELTARIRALTRREESFKTSVIKKFGIELNLQNHTARRGDIITQLTPKEMGILEYFMKNPGIVLTRFQIGEKVWDSEFDHRSNVIDSYIKLLRKKIDSEFDIKLIKTRRGAGYIFTDETI